MALGNTLLHQMLKLIPRHHFSRLEREHGTGRPARSFNRGHQRVHLIFMQLTSRASLRDGVAALKARFINLYHWESSRWPAPPSLTPITGGRPVFSKLSLP